MLKAGRYKAVFALIVSMMLLISSHVTVASQPEEESTFKMARAYTSLGFDIYDECRHLDGSENIFISPASIALALAMTYNGAAGETKEEMSGVLGISGMSDEEINETNRLLLESLKVMDRAVELSIANSLWLSKDLNFKEEFLCNSQKHFGADLFKGISAAKVNNWVKEETKGRIEKIVDMITPDVIAVLINAIYFNGTWKNEFDEKVTREDTFHLSACDTKIHPMMRQSGRYDYYECDAFQSIRLPYGKGRTGMYIFLPSEDSNMELFSERLTADNWNKWTSSMGKRRGRIVLPRFKTEFEISLKGILKQLGMARAFSPPDADFGAMCSPKRGNVFISEVLHKTYVDVNEKGTEAAAATSVTMALTSVSVEDQEEPFNMVVDRPFFVAIVDGETGLVLFMGSVTDPKL